MKGASPAHFRKRRRKADAALLPEGRSGGPMPWIIAIMVFLAALALALGAALGGGLMRLKADLAGRYTVQIVIADAARREARVQAVVRAVRPLIGVEQVNIVPEGELREQLLPWLGEEALEGSDLPVPALVDIKLQAGAPPSLAQSISAALAKIAPRQARLEAHATFLAPAEKVMRSLFLLSLLLVALMLLAMAAVVVLAARGALEANRSSLAILHQLGATDIQVARLFQRRAVLDTLLGGAIGSACAAGALALLARDGFGEGSAFSSLAQVPLWTWTGMLLVPLLAAGIAYLSARRTVRRVLRAML